MRNGQRVAAALSVMVAVPALVALPVVTGPQATVRPVAPGVTELALTGVDRAALAGTPTPAAETHGTSGTHEAHPSTPGQRVDDTARPDVAPVQQAGQAEKAQQGRPEPTAPLEPAAVIPATATKPFSLVAVDWRGRAPQGTTVQVRVREGGTWTPWQELEVDAGHRPDQGSVEDLAAVRAGTEPLLTAAGADGVQVRIDSAGGVLPQDARVSLIDPKSTEADALAAQTPPATAVAAGDPLKPAIITRAQWGADESLRSRGPIYTGPIKVGFVHHTASTSDYTPEQAAAQVRALYAYYTLSLKYSDIAYNFFVDRYGRLYEGRAGGMDKNVLGGHTAGFNENTFAVSAIGNYQTFKPSSTAATAMQTAIARLMAWKLALNHADPTGTATLVSNSSAGTSKYAVGETATVPVISGHRDIGSTACPGQYIEPWLPAIRTKAKALMGTQVLNPRMAPSVAPYGGTGGGLTATFTTAATWKLEVFSVCQPTPVRVRTGSVAAAGTTTITWNQKRQDGTPALPGTYRLVLSATNGSKVAYPVTTTFVVTPTATSPLGPCDTVSRVGSADRFAASVTMGRLTAPTARTVVVANGADSATAEALIAAPLAAVKGAPLLLSGPTSLPPVVAADVSARKATTAYVVGSTTLVPATVETQLRSLGVTTIVRLTGSSRPATAAAVADATGVRGRAVVVSFGAGSSLDASTAASALAASLKRPLLVVNPDLVPSSTAAVITRLGITSTVVVASRAAVQDSVVTAVKGTRAAGADDVATSVAAVAALAPKAARITALPVASGYGRAVAAASRRPVILGAGGTARIATWLTTAVAANVLAVAPTTVWADTALGGLAQTVAGRAGSTTAPAPAPVVAPAAVSPAVPAGFSFSGSGNGHGVGMSQYGARGMALAGSTATQIVTHYYSGTTVGPVKDDQDLRVNLLTRQSTVVLRTEALATGGGGIEVTVTGVAPVLGDTKDVWTVKAAGAGRITVLRTRAGVTTTVGTGTSIYVRWAGTRYPGKAGTAATVVNIAGSTAGFATSGHRYRYGVVTMGSTTASPSTFEVVNRVRIHDEYLLGLAEVSSSWPAASLQAQVLAARSYALARYGTGGVRGACLCQVDDGGGPYYDQTFAGWVKESSTGGANWRAAVKATEVVVKNADGTSTVLGNAVLSAGKPITAFYFSASGGRTQSSQDVWVATLPYAQGVDDPWSMGADVPWRQWVPRDRTQAQVAAAFGLPNVVSIDLSARTAAGGVRTAVATSSTGATASISGEQLRSRLSLPSTWVWRASTRYSGDAATVAAATAKSSTATTVVVAPVEAPDIVAVASSLAAQKGWALLLAGATGLPAATKAELVRRGSTARVYVVGTSAQLPSAVVTAVDAVAGTVSRVTGATDSDVSVAAAKLLARPAGSQAFVASAAAADSGYATAAAGISAARKGPLLLVPGGAAASDAVSAYLATLSPSSTVVVGPAASVADSVAVDLPSPSRIGGADAVAVSAAAVRWLGGAATRTVAVTSATGLVLGLVSAKGAPVLVVGTALAPATADALRRGVTTVVSTSALGSALLTAVRRA